jgi:hypothetical protein
VGAFDDARRDASDDASLAERARRSAVFCGVFSPFVRSRRAQIADVFVESSEVWSDLYSTYAQSYLAAVRQVRELQRSNAAFGAFLAEQRRQGDACVGVLDALVLPLGQLARHHVLLCQLLRRTDSTHVDYDSLEAAVDAANIMVGEMDEACTPLLRCSERLAQLSALVASIEADVPLPNVRSGIDSVRQQVQRLITACLAAPATPSVPHRADQLTDWHVAINDIETVLTQLKHKPGALERVRTSGLPPALESRFDELMDKVVQLFDDTFGDAIQQLKSGGGGSFAKPAGATRAAPSAAAAADGPRRASALPSTSSAAAAAAAAAADPGPVRRASSVQAQLAVERAKARVGAAQAAPASGANKQQPLRSSATAEIGDRPAGPQRSASVAGAMRSSAAPDLSRSSGAGGASAASAAGAGARGSDAGKPAPLGGGRASAAGPAAGSGAAAARQLVTRASMIGLSNGVASVIEDDEGQLMWVESFGRQARQVPCDKFFAALAKFLDHQLSDGEKRLLQYVINMGNDLPSIDVELFSGFLKGFGPLNVSLSNVKSILGSNWFYGFLSHAEAMRLLEAEPIGTYLVRFSLSKPGSFALEATILNPEGQPFVLPIQINSTPGGFAIHESDSGDREFASLHELISYYTAYLLQPLDSTIPFETWFHGEISSKEATALLAKQREGTFLLRFSSRPGCYASSFVEQGAVRHALILAVPGGYCVEGDTHTYKTVPDLVAGFNAGLQVPLEHPVNKVKQQIFAIAEKELQREMEAAGDDKYDLSAEFESSFRDPADSSNSSSQMSPRANSSSSSSSNALAARSRAAAALPTPTFAGAGKAGGAAAAAAAASKNGGGGGGGGEISSSVADGELVMMPDGKGIKGGTLEGLVEHLLENTASKFAKCFLLTYNSFTSPGELLAVLQQRYIRLCDAASGASIESKKLRLRICNFLKAWAQKYFASVTRDDADNDEFVREYRAFTESRIRPVDGDNLASQLIKTLERAIEQSRQDGVVVDGDGEGGAQFVFSSKPPKPDVPKKFDSWIDVSALEIARQMTLIEEELFRNVRPRELIGLAWTKKDKEKRAPNLLKISARFNAVSDWVKSSIVQEKDLKKRTKIFEKFVEIAVELGKLNNYNACMEITSALESASIFRLKKTKAKVSAKLLAKYDELHASLSRQQNYKALREAIHASNPPVIPYFGMYQSDLTFIEEGNPDMLKDTDPPLINFHKRRLVAQVLVDEVQQYQQAPYNLQKVPVLREKLEQALVENILDDNACYAESLVAEPRE